MSKDWSGNYNSIFKQLGATSHLKDGEEREENDFYATEPRAIDDLLNMLNKDREKSGFEFTLLDKNKIVWENACGAGHLSNRLKELGYQVRCSDIIVRDGCEGNVEVFDFLASGNDLFADSRANEKWNGCILTNPPYKFCTEFILNGLDKLCEGGGHVLVP